MLSCVIVILLSSYGTEQIGIYIYIYIYIYIHVLGHDIMMLSHNSYLLSTL